MMKIGMVFMSNNIRLILKMCLIFGGTLIGILLGLRLSIYLAPFIIAFAVATSIEPLITLLMKKVRLPRKVASAISVLLVLSVITLLLLLLFSRLYKEAVSLSKTQPEYLKEIYQNIMGLIKKASDIYIGLPEELTSNIDNMVSNLSDSISGILDSFVKGLYNTAVSIPQILIFILVTILSTYFLSSDREKIYGFIKHNLPESWLDKVLSIKNDMFMALFGYIKAQLILMTITFSELSMGFFIIGMKHFILLGLVISLIDAFPILGTGGVLIPWSIYELLTGDYKMAVSLLVLYVVVLVIRQLIEPKVLGEQIGLHPLVTLMSMYLGLQFLGFVGLIVGPVTVLLFKNIISGIVKQRSLKEFISDYCKK